MSSVKRILGTGIFFVLIFTACEQIPSHIIAPEQMETLLIDIHKAEAISDNLTQYASDREKERLRQSVFDRHHVTQAQFDTSLVWYSEHMTKYSQIYNNVTARLKEEDDAVKTLLVERKSSPSPGLATQSTYGTKTRITCSNPVCTVMSYCSISLPTIISGKTISSNSRSTSTNCLREYPTKPVLHS